MLTFTSHYLRVKGYVFDHIKQIFIQHRLFAELYTQLHLIKWHTNSYKSLTMYGFPNIRFLVCVLCQEKPF